MSLKVPVACFSLLMSFQANAQVYTWKDANGVTHFTDEVPAEEPSAKTITVADPMTVPAVKPDVSDKQRSSKETGAVPQPRENETPGQAVWRDKLDQINDVMRQVKQFALPSD